MRHSLLVFRVRKSAPNIFGELFSQLPLAVRIEVHPVTNGVQLSGSAALQLRYTPKRLPNHASCTNFGVRSGPRRGA